MTLRRDALKDEADIILIHATKNCRRRMYAETRNIGYPHLGLQAQKSEVPLSVEDGSQR